MDIKEQFTKAIEENKGLIFKVTALYTDSYQDRKDLYQEIVYQLWKSFDSFKEQSKLSTWMYRIALNTAVYNLKQTKKRIETGYIDLVAEQFAIDIDRTQEERIKLLHKHIEKLNLLEKGIILLYLEGKSYEDIASIVGITVSNVGTRISRIKEKLKSQIVKRQ